MVGSEIRVLCGGLGGIPALEGLWCLNVGSRPLVSRAVPLGSTVFRPVLVGALAWAEEGRDEEGAPERRHEGANLGPGAEHRLAHRTMQACALYFDHAHGLHALHGRGGARGSRREGRGLWRVS